MIKDKNGNRVNFIKVPALGRYIDQIKDNRMHSSIWASPCCVLLPYTFNAKAAAGIKFTVTTLSEPKPQRDSTTTLKTGDYIYCNEEITMDYPNRYNASEGDNSMYFYKMQINYYDDSYTSPFAEVLPKKFKYNRQGDMGLTDFDYNNNTDIVYTPDELGGNEILTCLDSNDYTGVITFKKTNGTYERPAFTRFRVGRKFKYKLTYRLDSEDYDFNFLKDTYNNGTFELSSNGTTHTGSVEIVVTGDFSSDGYNYAVITLVGTSVIPLASGSAAATEIKIKPSPNATALKQTNLVGGPTSFYGVDSSVFGEEDCYIERERIETSDGLTNKYNLYICGTNKRLYTFEIEAKSISWLTKTGNQTDVTTMTLNQQGGITYPGQNYRILIHQATQDTAIENEFMTLKVDGKHVLGINFNYTFTFDTNLNFFGVPNMVFNISHKILDTIKKVS